MEMGIREGGGADAPQVYMGNVLRRVRKASKRRKSPAPLARGFALSLQGTNEAD